MTRLETAAERVQSLHDAFATMWVWVLTLTLVLFMVVVFHGMEANGWLEPGAVESLEIVFHIMIGMVFFGTALLILGTALSLGAYYQERRSS